MKAKDMKKLITAAALVFAFASNAAAQTINALGAGRGSVIGADLFPSYQGANPAVRPSAAQIAAYVYGLASGDLTANGTGTHTLATVNANVGSFGSATNCVSFTTNAKGLITAASQTTCTPAVASITGLGTGVASALAAALNSGTGLVGALTPTNNNCVIGNGSAWTSAACPGGTAANPTATAGPTAVNGAASTYMRSDAAPAVQQGSSSQKGIVQVDGTTITESSGVISAAPITAIPSVQTGSNYPIVAGDRAKVIYLSNASPQTPTLPVASTPGNGWFVTACNIAAGIQTITPTTSTIGGAASYALSGGSAISPRCVNIVSDGTNYVLVPAGNSYTIASGTSALGTGAITSATCATLVTTSAPGVATTDVVLASFNGDTNAVTGYVPLTSGMLTIKGYPTANNVNFSVCNNTSSSITPGAVTLNWRVIR